jgi:hypothetical protein
MSCPPGQILFDKNFLSSMPKSYLYDPAPKTDPTTGKVSTSSQAYNQTYAYRPGKKPYQTNSNLLSTGTPSSTNFSAALIHSKTGTKLSYSELQQQSPSDFESVNSQQLAKGFNACTADPNCWGIALQNTFDPNICGPFSGSYIFNYYTKPTGTIPANTDPDELLQCDFTNTWYTFIKQLPGTTSNKPLVCIPPPSATKIATPTSAPAAAIDCPFNMASKPVSTPNYYYCVAQQKIPETSIWSRPTTWIIIIVVILSLGAGYYFWSKNSATTSEVDYSKYFKKKKGGYYFLV